MKRFSILALLIISMVSTALAQGGPPLPPGATAPTAIPVNGGVTTFFVLAALVGAVILYNSSKKKK